MACTRIRFKVASEPWEFDEIARLNYRTFVLEIPQHPRSQIETLIDRFHHENTYIIGVHGNTVIAMAAVRGCRPFSLDAKVPNLDRFLPLHCEPCEIRLLAIDPRWRHTRVAAELLSRVAAHCVASGFDLTVISGTVRQLRMYEHLGFVKFGPLVGSTVAPYQPMYLEIERFRTRAKGIRLPAASRNLNFLPGPVGVSDAVRDALARPPISHRCPKFIALVNDVRERLCRLTGASHVNVLSGSGTHANDAIAAQLSLRADKGIVLTQGEFGDRLVDHATRFGVLGAVVRQEWGKPCDLDAVGRQLSRARDIGWLWAVHCETSSGALNDLAGLKKLCARRRIDLCLDCVSSIGTMPIDLRGVHLASASSGKGLAAYSGLALVFHDRPIRASTLLPRAMDLGLYDSQNGIPFTLSSNLVEALLAALDEQTGQRYASIAALGAELRRSLSQLGLHPIVVEHASPAVTTVLVPHPIRSTRLGRWLRQQGIWIAFESEFLHKRNAVQFCLMGHQTADDVRSLLDALQTYFRSAIMPRTENPSGELHAPFQKRVHAARS